MTAKSFGRWDAKEMAFVHGEGKDARIIWTAEDCSREACEMLNAAVRKYAADAIREASIQARHDLSERVEDWLLAYADRFEQGNL